MKTDFSCSDLSDVVGEQFAGGKKVDSNFINLTLDNLANEHLCCAIADKKHQCGVDTKRAWLSERISEGHVFRKLNQKGKVFIEYAPLETACKIGVYANCGAYLGG